jgi:putative peptide zinc metalloprotease protein
MISGRRMRVLGGLLAMACVLPVGSAQAAPAGHHDVSATAVNHTDATQVDDFAWGISRQRGGDVVDQSNAAHAYSRCTDCAATAIAFQIVLVSGSPTTVIPRNEATAINESCTRCQTAAEARQFVRVVPERVRFTSSGLRELASIRRDLRALAYADLPVAELHQGVEDDEARVNDVLANDLVTVADPHEDADVLDARLLQDTDAG